MKAQTCFFIMSKHLRGNDYEFEEIKPQILTHLTNLESNSKNHFSDPFLGMN